MAHELDMTNGRANIAFLGSRKDVWHRLGQEMGEGQSIEQWADAAGLNWEARMVPAFANVGNDVEEYINAEGWQFITRSDNNAVLGCVSDRYQPVQPAEVLEWFRDYISIDERFKLDVAGSLKGGAVVWATAKFNGEMDIVGEKHVARLLMTTTFDGTRATINQATMTRVVCNNTLTAALYDKSACVRTRHNKRFNAEQVSSELAQVAQGFENYKVMAEAMVGVKMAKRTTTEFFEKLLDIKRDEDEAKISTNKLNKLFGLERCLDETIAEGTAANTAWAALNAVTRYVDHERSTRGGDRAEALVYSSQFGSGATMKAKALELLAV